MANAAATYNHADSVATIAAAAFAFAKGELASCPPADMATAARKAAIAYRAARNHARRGNVQRAEALIERRRR